MSDDEDTFSMLMWIINIGMLTLVIMSVYTIMTIIHTQDITSNELELDILINSIHNNEAILYKDNLTKRVYLGTIDYKKLKNANLSETFKSDSKAYAVRMTIQVNNQSFSKYYLSGKEDTEQNFKTKATLEKFDNRLTTKLTTKKSNFYIDGEIHIGTIKYTALKET